MNTELSTQAIQDETSLAGLAGGLCYLDQQKETEPAVSSVGAGYLSAVREVLAACAQRIRIT